YLRVGSFFGSLQPKTKLARKKPQRIVANHCFIVKLLPPPMEKEPAANLRSALKIPAFQSSGPLLGSTGSRHHRRSGAGDASRGLVRRLLVVTFVGGLCGFIFV